MSVNVAANQIIEVTFKGKCLEQEVMNKFHLKIADVPAGQTTFDEFVASLDALLATVPELYSSYRLAMPVNWEATDNVYQIIHPTRYVAQKVDKTGVVGGNTFTTLTANVAVCLTKRGDLAGRKFISTTHLLGTTVDGFIEDGRLTPFAATALGLISTKMKGFVTVGVDLGDVNAFWGIYHKDGGTDEEKWTNITSVLTQQSVRVMRRRTLGIGS